MAEFTVNQRFDPYKNMKFRIKWDAQYVAGVSKMSPLRRTTEVVLHLAQPVECWDTLSSEEGCNVAA